MPNTDNLPQLPKNQSNISDPTNGIVTRDWYRFFLNLLNKVNEGGGGGGGTGTVTSVNVSGGTTGLSASGGPVTTSGTITLSGTVNVAHGGTGATTSAAALTNLGAYPASNPNGYTSNTGTVTSVAASVPSFLSVSGSPITSSGTLAITYSGTALPIANGGTAGTTASDARTNLGLVIGTDIPSPTGTGASGTWAIGITGNSGTVTNGVYTSGSYSDPAWITSLAGTKISGNISGNAANVTGTVAIANGGTGQTTKTPAFNALSPTTTKGDLILNNGTDNVRQAVGADGLVLQADSTTATGVKWAATATNTIAISNDTTTATNLYPTFAAATTGSVSTIYTGNAKLLYKPSTGELTSPQLVASNGIFVNSLTISTNYTIAAGNSGMSAGVVAVASGVTVTVSSGSRWVVV